jgi:uncharacterized damage-inducible protein DinB
MNPYASFLGARDPLTVISATPTRLSELLDKLGPQGVERSLAPGKWSVREILAHLADCELCFAYRIRQTLAEPHYVIQPFDQELWAATYAAYDARGAWAVFSAVRGWNMRLIKSLPKDAFAKKVNHPERGDMTLATIIETMGGHDLNHLGQVETIAGQ